MAEDTPATPAHYCDGCGNPMARSDWTCFTCEDMMRSLKLEVLR